MTVVSLIALALTGCLLAMVLVPAASYLASATGLVDIPNTRKHHVGHVPLAGGFVLLVAMFVSVGLLPASLATWAAIILSIPLFVVGTLDDRFDIPARFRLIAQLAIGACFVWGFGLTVSQLDGVLGDAPIYLSALVAAIFTIVCVSGVLNATNMADGIDGLLGAVASLSLLAIGGLAFYGQAFAESALALFVFGVLAGYLLFNLGVFGEKRKIFLGDSGSMIIGLVLLVLLIQLSQGNNPVITATSAGWLLGLPLLDTVSVMVRRIANGRAPFSAGRDHFHHVLQDLGLRRTSTLQVLVIAQLVFVVIGIFANFTTQPQYLFFWTFVGLTVIQFAGISVAIKAAGKDALTEHGLSSDVLVDPSIIMSESSVTDGERIEEPSRIDVPPLVHLREKEKKLPVEEGVSS